MHKNLSQNSTKRACLNNFEAQVVWVETGNDMLFFELASR